MGGVCSCYGVRDKKDPSKHAAEVQQANNFIQANPTSWHGDNNFHLQIY